MKYLLIIFLCFHCSLCFAKKTSDIEVIINLEEKAIENNYGKISILIKYLDATNRIDTLNTVEDFSEKEILKFRTAKISLNVNYSDRSSGFQKFINRRGKLRFRVWNLEKKREIGLRFLKDKFASEDWLNITLSDSKQFQPGIYMNDYKDNWTFSSSELFEIANIWNNDPNKKNQVSLHIESNTVKAVCWINKYNQAKIEKVKREAESLFHSNDDALFLKFKNLKFYLKNSPNYKHRYTIEANEK